MNKKIKVIVALIALITAMNVYAANKKKTVYVFGFSASFNDSIVYFTDIQRIDGATITTKTKFLVDRSQYSEQLRQYFNTSGQPNRTCMVMYGLTQKEAEKKLVSLRNKYAKSGKYDIKYLTANNFAFKVVDNVDEEQLPVAKVDESKKKGGKVVKEGKRVKAPKKGKKKDAKE